MCLQEEVSGVCHPWGRVWGGRARAGAPPPASLPGCCLDHSPQLRNCATLRSRRREALLSSWCSPSSRSRRPSSPGLPPASPRTSCSSARSRCSIVAAGAPQPRLEPGRLHAPSVRPSLRPTVRPWFRGSLCAASPHPPALPAVTFLRRYPRSLTWPPAPPSKPAPDGRAGARRPMGAATEGEGGKAEARGGGADPRPGSGRAGHEK